MSPRKILLLLTLLAAIAAFVALDLGRWLSLAALQQHQAALAARVAAQPLAAAALYFAVYVLATALSVPGAVILTLAGGALFGLGWGLLLVSFASSLGATLAFLAARFVLRDTVEARFGQRLAEVNRGIARDGAFYLFTLRLIPVVPFFVINLVMGAHPHAGADLLCHQPAGHAGGHGRVRERGHAAGAAAVAAGHPVAGG
jgi:uncharacterized membrane protein YdjX (TVP38/TMEM64 family)